jgi:sensor histidine kinase YesM
MQVEDNGPGLKGNSNDGLSGIGLSNTRARLGQFYGDDFSFEIANAAGRGVIVTLDVPAVAPVKSEG